MGSDFACYALPKYPTCAPFIHICKRSVGNDTLSGSRLIHGKATPAASWALLFFACSARRGDCLPCDCASTSSPPVSGLKRDHGRFRIAAENAGLRFAFIQFIDTERTALVKYALGQSNCYIRIFWLCMFLRRQTLYR